MPRLRAGGGCLWTTCALLAILPLLPCLHAEYVQTNVTTLSGYRLAPGVSSIPPPVTVAPDQDWLGIDGSWNTFSLFLGNPRQNTRVLVSTASQQIWAVNQLACVSNTTNPGTGQVDQSNPLTLGCDNSRGFLFNTTESSTWQEKGYYQLRLGKALGLVGNGLYGFDSVALGFPGEEGPSTKNSTIGTLVSADFWLGHIGLHSKSTNFSESEAPVPSYMKNLFDQGNIPSLSFGYTAGAQYHGQTVLGSLTLGGYDASRLIRNDLTFVFAPDNDRDLVVGIVNLVAATSNKSDIALLRGNDINMFIDSTVAEMWLPLEICQAFEDAFGLQYDAATDLYLVDDSLYAKLLAQNLSLTFTLGQLYRTDSTVQITLPYAALDLVASPPYRGLRERTKYFPIRRGKSSSQWILGRTFLQEAYLTVDWERQNFSVSAIDWTFGNPVHLITIVSPRYMDLGPTANPHKKLNLSSQAIVGIAVSSGCALTLLVLAIGWWIWRRRQRRKLGASVAKHEGEKSAAAAVASKTKGAGESDEIFGLPAQEGESPATAVPKAELYGDLSVRHEMAQQEKEASAAGVAGDSERPIYEMAGDSPKPQEVDGRQLSEKETMVVRERLYNGVDPSCTVALSPMVQDGPRRLATVSPSEVTVLNGQTPNYRNVSPTAPRTPRDGALLEASGGLFQLQGYTLRDDRGTEGYDTPILPTSPPEGSTDHSRQRFSYES